MRDLTISTKVLSENPHTGNHEIEVTVNGRSFYVYTSNKGLELDYIKESHPDLRTYFSWDNWIFDNIRGDYISAAVLAALAVVISNGTISSGFNQ